jgi:DNA polymerase III sliding clamp (beta) subunit (PCNA family)
MALNPCPVIPSLSQPMTFTSPVVFTPTGIDGVTYLVMPIQIRG